MNPLARFEGNESAHCPFIQCIYSFGFGLISTWFEPTKETKLGSKEPGQEMHVLNDLAYVYRTHDDETGDGENPDVRTDVTIDETLVGFKRHVDYSCMSFI